MEEQLDIRTPKICEYCGNDFIRTPEQVGPKQWAKARFCTRPCKNKAFVLDRKAQQELLRRQEKILELISQNRTLEEIGEEFGISRQRVEQISKHEYIQVGM